MLISSSQYFSTAPEAPQVLCKFLCYNNYIKIENTLIYEEKITNENTKLLLQLFQNSRIIPWVNLKDEYELK